LAKLTALIVGIFFALSCIDKLEYNLFKNGSEGIVIDIFFSKLHVQITQRGLSIQTFNFWRSIVSQKKGVKDLFQPAVGKIRGNLEQLSGNPVSVFGMFSAFSEQNASFYILQDDVPNFDVIPALAVESLCANCLELFPESTNVRPSFWVD
jgi:hypothetical protein